MQQLGQGQRNQFFSGLNTAKASVGNDWFLAGVYPKVAIVSVTTSNSPMKGPMFHLTCEIIESDVEGRNEGMKCDWTVKMQQPSAMSNLKAWLEALFSGYPALQQHFLTEYRGDFEMFLGAAIDNPQLLAGFEMKLQCTMIKTKAGNDFTKHRWFALDAEITNDESGE